MSDPTTEYEICQRRGHNPTGVGVTDTFRTWWICKWCGTKYATETVAQTIEEPGSQPVSPPPEQGDTPPLA